MKIYFFCLCFVISTTPTVGFSISSEQKSTMIEECVKEFGYTEVKCEEWLNKESDREELEQLGDDGQNVESVTVDAATTALLFISIIASIISSVKDSKLRPSGIVSIVIGVLVGVSWIVFSITQWAKMSKHKKEVKDKYGDSLTLTKTTDENYAELQTKVMDEYIDDLKNQIEVHEVRRAGARAGVIGFAIPLLISAIELVLCVVPYTSTFATARGWCSDPSSAASNINSKRPRILSFLFPSSYAGSSDIEVSDEGKKNVLTGLQKFLGVLGAVALVPILSLVKGKNLLKVSVFTRCVAYGVDVAIMVIQSSYQQKIIDELNTRIDDIELLKEQLLQELDGSANLSGGSIPGQEISPSLSLSGEGSDGNFYQNNCVDQKEGEIITDPGCKSEEKISLSNGLSPTNPFTDLIDVEGVNTNPIETVKAAERLLNEKISPDEAFKSLGVNDGALMERLTKDLLKKAVEKKPDLFGKGGSFDQAVENEFIKQLKQVAALVDKLSPEQKTALGNMTEISSEEINNKKEKNSFVDALNRKKNRNDLPSVNLPKLKIGNLRGGGEASQRESISSNTAPILKKYKFDEKDINENEKASLWQLLRHRYMKSGYPRLFNLDK